MTGPPEGCTCIWSMTETFGSIYIVGQPCPVFPHPRTYNKEKN